VDPLVISVISAATALVASIVGPLVTLSVGRRQFAATVLSTNRQRWIDMLRESLAELVSQLATVSVIKATWQEKWDKGIGPIAADPCRLEKLQRLVLVQFRIRLLLNPAEADHQELYRAIELSIERLREERSVEEETAADVETISKLGQAILKREWQRVKSGT
jgi:hypothetical protein